MTNASPRVMVTNNPRLRYCKIHVTMKAEPVNFFNALAMKAVLIQFSSKEPKHINCTKSAADSAFSVGVGETNTDRKRRFTAKNVR
jgi:hypothetical protein